MGPAPPTTRALGTASVDLKPPSQHLTLNLACLSYARRTSRARRRGVACGPAQHLRGFWPRFALAIELTSHVLE